MPSTDQILVCADCGTEFAFSAEEQEFFQEKGFNAPRRCKPCRVAAKAARGNGDSASGPRSPMGGSSFGAPRGDREMFDVTCDQCGAATQVPFKPNGAKPVYCRDCFRR